MEVDLPEFLVCVCLPFCTYVYMCPCVSVYVCACPCLCVYLYMCVHVSVCMCMCLCKSVSVCMCLCMCVCMSVCRYICVCLCMCMSVCLHMLLCVSTHSCTYMRKPDVDFEYLPQLLSTLISETESLIEAELGISVRLLRKPWGPPVFWVSSMGITEVQHHIQLFSWHWRSSLGSCASTTSILPNKPSLGLPGFLWHKGFI